MGIRKNTASTEAAASTEVATPAVASETPTQVPASAQVTAQLSSNEAGDSVPTEIAEAVRAAKTPVKVVASAKMKVAEFPVMDENGQQKQDKDGKLITSTWLDGFAFKVLTSTKHGQEEHYLKIFGRAADFKALLATAMHADATLSGVIGSIFPAEGVTVEDLQTLTGKGCPIYLDTIKPGLNKVMVRGSDGIERPETELTPVFWLKVTKGGTMIFSLYGSYNKNRQQMQDAWAAAKAAITYAVTYNGGYISGMALNARVQAEVKKGRTVTTVTAATSATGPAVATGEDLGSLAFAPDQNRRQGRGEYRESGYRGNGGNYRGNNRGQYRGNGNGYGSRQGQGSRASGRTNW